MKYVFHSLPLFLMFVVGNSFASPSRVDINLSLTSSGFIPDTVTIIENTSIKINLLNKTDKIVEFESHDMKFEKIAVPQGHISVFTGPLKSGKYTFFDDYSSNHTTGIVMVKAKK
ncbi:MAG: cupredoxin domain-containing protein [Ostreibacterium sp.]